MPPLIPLLLGGGGAAAETAGAAGATTAIGGALDYAGMQLGRSAIGRALLGAGETKLGQVGIGTGVGLAGAGLYGLFRGDNTPNTQPGTNVLGASQFNGLPGPTSSDFSKMIQAPNLPAYPGASPEQQAALAKMQQSGMDLDALTKRLLADSGSITSQDSQVDAYMTAAINTQKQFMEASRARVESQYSREFDYTLQDLTQQKTAMQEAAIGGSGDVTPYAMEKINNTIQKSLRDLQTRKEEAINLSDATAYQKISDLQVKQLEMHQSAQEKYFNRLMGIGQLQSTVVNNLNNTAQVARNMTQDQLDYEMKSAGLQLQYSNDVADAAYKNAHVKVLQNELAIKGNLPMPGWDIGYYGYNVQSQATKSIAQMTSMIGQTPTPELASQLGLPAGRKIDYKTIYDTMSAQAQTNVNTFGAIASKDAVLAAHGFVNAPGTPLQIGNKYVYSDGSVTNAPIIPPTPAEQLQQSVIPQLKENANNPQPGSSMPWWQGLLNDVFGVTKAEGAEFPTGTVESKALPKGWENMSPLEQISSAFFGLDSSSDTQPQFSDLGKVQAQQPMSLEEKKAALIEQNKNNPAARTQIEAPPLNPFETAWSNPNNRIDTQQVAPNKQLMLKAIGASEGYYTGDPNTTVPVRFNNPGSLVWANQPGAVKAIVTGVDGVKRAFAKFPSPQAGWQALDTQLQRIADGLVKSYGKDPTLAEVIKTYAPASENDTDNYIKYVSSALAVDPDTKFKDIYN